MHLKVKVVYLVPLLLIGLIGSVFWGVSRGRNPEPSKEEVSRSTKVEGNQLKLGSDYYICPTLVETTPLKSKTGFFSKKPKEWDRNGTAPDVECKISWNGNVVFSSGEKRDSIIANWSPIGTDVANLISSGKIRLDSVIQAATIQFEAGGSIDFEVWDNDAFTKEEIGRLNIPLDSMKEGINKIDTDGLPNIRRIELLVISKNQPEAKLIQQLLMY